MEPQTHLGRSFIIVIISFIVGAIIGVFIDPYLPSSLSNAKKGYQTGFTAARTLVENSSIGNFFKTQSDVRSVSGRVIAIQGNRISIHNESIKNPFEVDVPSDRIIIVDTTTKVIQLTVKDSKTIQAEFNAFIKAQKTSRATSTLAISRELYIQTIVNASSIKVGDSLVVTAGENVKTVAEFTATEIQIQPKIFTK